MDWPAHSTASRRWTPQGRRGNLEDRLLTEIEVQIPPLIATLPVAVTGDTARRHEDAVIAVTRLDAGFGQHLAPLADFLVRSESVASSKIEQVDSGWHAFGRAVAGAKASAEAQSQRGAVHALLALVDAAASGPIEEAAILEAHRLLMAPDPYADRPGAYRSVQNWVGGSDYSPVGALFVPPPPEMVSGLMADLMAFAGRTDLPILAQAAIAHAQFESIHPFSDGNGRVGRALISAILRRRGLTARVTVPMASAMLADTDRYFRCLTEYRRGGAEQFVGYVADAAVHASEAAAESAARLAVLPERWREIARPRANSADEALIDRLLDVPIFNADTAQAMTGTTEASTYKALSRLTDAGVLELLSTGKRNRVWAASDVLTELDALSEAVGRRSASG